MGGGGWVECGCAGAKRRYLHDVLNLWHDMSGLL